MSDTTTSRVLGILSLLQSRRYWPGSELAERLGVSARTIRRDIDRLRELGYRVTAERGSAGGYLLEAGSSLPPLLFTGDEAVALAVALRSAAQSSSVRGMPDLSVAVLAKLEQVLPSALRGRVRAMQAAVVTEPPIPGGMLVDADSLAVLALVCRDSEVVRFRYRTGEGEESARRVEPHALVSVGRRWYLVAWDPDRDDWRTFRVDRLSDPAPTGVHRPPRPLPALDAAAFVVERLGRAAPAVEALVRIDAPHPVVTALLGDFTTGLSADGPRHTLWALRDERVELLAGALAWVPWTFTIVEGAQLEEFLSGFLTRWVAPPDPVEIAPDA